MSNKKKLEEEDSDFDMETEQMEYEAFLEHMKKEATKEK
jgi:hypothetical protein